MPLAAPNFMVLIRGGAAASRPAPINAGAMLQTRMQSMFFDRKAVTDRMEKKKLRIYRQAGGTVRKIARNSLKYRKGPSSVGQVPHVHRGDDGDSLLKSRLFFAYDAARDSIVVGPAFLNKVTFKEASLSAPGVRVPELLEKGGRAYVFEILKYGRWQRADLRSRRRIAEYPQRFRGYTMGPRPYMAPALEKAQPYILKLFGGSFGG